MTGRTGYASNTCRSSAYVTAVGITNVSFGLLVSSKNIRNNISSIYFLDFGTFKRLILMYLFLPNLYTVGLGGS